MHYVGKMMNNYSDTYALTKAIRTFERILVGHRPKDLPNDSYEYIPFNLESFIKQIKVAYKLAKRGNTEPQFLDIGCGIGTKVMIARTFFAISHGVEISKEYYDIAKKLTNYCNAYVFHEDALKFKNYHEYDVLYYYCPIADYNKQRELEKLVCECMKPGAILLANLRKSSEEKFAEWGVHQIKDSEVSYALFCKRL
jgi:SAM-dependent methyltransferase